MNSETNQLMDYLYKIAERSLNGDIPWNQPNPSTFQWIQGTNDGDSFFVTIQKAALPSVKGTLGMISKGYDENVYLFQVQDRSTKQTVLSLSTKERPDVYDPLAEIYHNAEKGMDVRATSVLKRLLSE